MSTPPRLDLTGQASEDEPASRALHQQMVPVPSHAPNNEHQEPSSQSQSQQTTTHQTDSPSAHDDDDDDQPNNTNLSNNNNNTTTTRGGVLGGILTHLPCPIDLWQSRTPTSLLLLPLVFILFVVLQLPLHYNSTNTENNAATIHSLSRMEWKGRARDVDKYSKELKEVEKELDTVKGDQVEIRGMVSVLRRRLGDMKERRTAREERLRMWEEKRREREEIEKQQQQQQGVARDGPITTVTMVKALAVATFAGKPNIVDDAKKGD